MTNDRKMAPLKIYLPLLLALAIAAAFRFPLLNSLPPGLNFDEGGEGVAALDVMHGNFKIWWDIGGGKEPLMAYLVQPLFWLFGPTRLALRLYAALMGVGTVAATWFFAHQLFYVEPEDESLLRFVPLLAALGLATAFWHVAYSRIAFRALSNPLVEALALGFLWRGLRTNRRRDFLLAGVFTGGLIYTYLAGRFVPVAIALFFTIEAVIAWGQRRTPLLVQFWRQLAATVGVAALVFAPVGVFFIRHPALFVARAGAVSIFSPAMNHGDLWGTLWRTTLTTAGTFFSLTGDPNALGNIPGKPELSPLLAVFFVLGIICILYFTFREPRFKFQSAGFHLETWNLKPGIFLLVWWPVMLLPAILAPEGAPHHLRLIGTAPGTYIFVALGMVGVIQLVRSRWSLTPHNALRNVGPLVWLLAFVVFGLTAFQTYQDYFIYWANDVDHYMDFDVYATELAQQMTADNDPTTAYAIPMDLRAAHEARHYTLDFLYHGQTPFSYVLVDETTVAQSLTEAARGKTTLKVVRWVRDKHREADARELVTFLLDTAGTQLTATAALPVYTLETYRLPSANTRFALPAIKTPVDATLDGVLQVRRAVVSPLLTVSSAVAVAVTYAPIAPITADYKASLRLVAPNGAVVAQKDRMLLHNWHQPTSLWPREEVNEYYLLPLPPKVVPGAYQVRLVVYHPDTLVPLTDNGQAEIALGMAHVTNDK